MTDIVIRNLTKRFSAGGKAAVDNVNLEIRAGEIVALLGPSGCGKTTTLKMIAGLLEPEEGDIRFDGISILSVPSEKRGAVMVFQEHALFPFMSVGDNIAFGLRVRGVGKKEIQDRVQEMLDLVQLPGIYARSPAELSGGQRQRVALARALIIRPRLLLLDEPLANLDAHLRDGMRSLILSVQRKTGVTTIVVTHDQEEAVMLADRIALMFDGTLDRFAPARDFFERPLSERSARFFGGRNFIPARKEGDTAHTPLGDFTLDPRRSGLMRDGESVLTVRPEQIVIGGTAATANTIWGTVLSCMFLGTRIRCFVQAGDFQLEVSQSADTGMLAEGERVTLSFVAEHLWLFPRDG